MRTADRRRRASGVVPERVTPALVVALFGGLLGGVLAFSQAAASTGIVIDSFRPLGGVFFSWRSGQTQLARSLHDGRTKVDPKLLTKSGRTGLSYAPLSARSLWMVGKGYEAEGNMPRARTAMERAEKITRRDATVQLWLSEDAIRRKEINEALGHYDLIIRSTPEARSEILPRLAALMVAPLGRKYLLSYARPSNPWFPDLLATAVERLPRVEPVGLLLLERRAKAPNLPQLEPVYSKLVAKLVSEGSHDVALDLYPLLPRGDVAVLRNVSGVIDGKPLTGYAPFIWDFATEASGATLVSTGAGQAGMEFYGSSGTIGVAASKLVAPGQARQIRWRIDERSPNLQSSAAWVATCLSGQSEGARQTSVNLLDKAVPTGKDLTMTLPTGCTIVRLDMRIAGGIGSNPASLIITRLSLAK